MVRPKRTRAVDASTTEPVSADAAAEANESQEVAEPPAKRTRSNPKRAVTEKAAGKRKAKEGSEPTDEASEPPVDSESEAEAGTSTAAPRAKKKRASKKATQATGSRKREERRTTKYLTEIPEATKSRFWSLRHERIFLVDRTRNGEELKEAFSVLGTTGNVYTVTIDQKPRCNCPDFLFRRNHCKHLIFVFFKVLQVSEDSTDWYQKSLLNSELEQIFRNAPIAPNSMAHARVLEAHAKATGKAPVAAPDAAAVPGNRRVPTEEDDCPVCYESMHDVDDHTLEFCIVCGNALHKECFAQWKRSATLKGNPLTCVWCRADWRLQEPIRNLQASRGRMGYLNLAAAAYGSCK